MVRVLFFCMHKDLNARGKETAVPLSKETAHAIAALVHALRPEWDRDGVLASLRPLANRHPGDVALAAVRAAYDDGARTPGVIPTDGPHWRERVAPDEAPRMLKLDDMCSACSGDLRVCGCGAPSWREHRARQAAAAERQARNGSGDPDHPHAARIAEARAAIRAAAEERREREAGWEQNRQAAAARKAAGIVDQVDTPEPPDENHPPDGQETGHDALAGSGVGEGRQTGGEWP